MALDLMITLDVQRLAHRAMNTGSYSDAADCISMLDHRLPGSNHVKDRVDNLSEILKDCLPNSPMERIAARAIYNECASTGFEVRPDRTLQEQLLRHTYNDLDPRVGNDPSAQKMKDYIRTGTISKCNWQLSADNTSAYTSVAQVSADGRPLPGTQDARLENNLIDSLHSQGIYSAHANYISAGSQYLVVIQKSDIPKLQASMARYKQYFQQAEPQVQRVTSERTTTTVGTLNPAYTAG